MNNAAMCFRFSIHLQSVRSINLSLMLHVSVILYMKRITCLMVVSLENMGMGGKLSFVAIEYISVNRS